MRETGHKFWEGLIFLYKRLYVLLRYVVLIFCFFRFVKFKQEPLKCFAAFKLMLMPDSLDELADHGNEDVCKLANHFSDVLSDVEKDESVIRSEYAHLKAYLKPLKTRDELVIYSQLLATRPSKFKNILTLVEIMFSISCSTAKAERSFSAMNLIKTPNRCSLHEDTLQHLLRVYIEGPPLAGFNPDPAIDKWLTCGPGSRHVRGHNIPQ